jgi:hypothetical protein
VATAHGVSSINLLPKDSFEFSALGKVLKWVTTVGRVLVVLTEFVVLLAFATRFYFDRKLSDMGEVLDQKKVQIEAYGTVEAEMRRVLEKQQPVKAAQTGGLGFGPKIDYLTGIVPVGTVLDGLTLNKDGLGISGVAQSEYGFAQLVASIKKMPNVSKVNMKSTSFDQITGGVKFSILISFK